MNRLDDESGDCKYEMEEHQAWCSRCEHWEESCTCPSEEAEKPLSLDQTESLCDWIDHVWHQGQTAYEIKPEDRPWEEDIYR